jgi:dephospho-CoA kinase
MVYVIGITGNIACGKTLVGQMLLELGAERYIDADALVHRLYEKGQPIAEKIREIFGPETLAPDGGVNRQKLGAIVFHDRSAMQQLERIVHPAVSEVVRQELSTVSERGIAVLDAVKLLEGGSSALCQRKWLIICPEEQEMARLMARNHLSRAEAQARIDAQPDTEKRRALVDEVIDNGSSIQQTREQVIAALTRFRQQVHQPIRIQEYNSHC